MSITIDFDRIYHEEVVEALKNDTLLNWPARQPSKKYLSGGTCPGCGEKELFISLEKPYKLKCNRTNQCQYEEKTRDRYSDLFENLSERFPKTEANPNASADAFMSRKRGFPLEKVKGLYKQATIKITNKATGQSDYAESVQFTIANGTWSRLIDESKIVFHNNDKAKISYDIEYKRYGWTPPNQVIAAHDQVFIVEGIFHAIALWLTGRKVIAAITCHNFPWDIFDAEKGKQIRWVLAYDSDKAGIDAHLKYYQQVSEQKELVQVALTRSSLNHCEDWDDVYRAGQLNQDYIDECLYRGNLLTARSKEWKAYYMFRYTNKSVFLVDFKGYLYSVKLNLTEYAKDDDSDEVEETSRFQIFLKHVTIKQDCNCVPQFEYIQQDPLTEEQQYYFSFVFPNAAQNRTVALPPNALSNARAFRSALLDKTPGGNFEGNDKTLAILSGQWLRDVMTIKALPFVGYDEETEVYCFQDFGYKHGKRLKINSHNFISVDGQGIKTKLKKPEILIGTKDFNTEWFNDFDTVYQNNGLTALAWWTASLFVQQIKKRQKSWPFLEHTGEKGAGKSSLIRLLNGFIGRPNFEGVNPNNTSDTGFRRTISQLSNMPLALIESDVTKTGANGKKFVQQFNWDSIKDLYDYNGYLAVRGVKSNDNETNELIYRGSICIAQNESIDASDAILSRIVHIHASLANHSHEAADIAERLNNLPPEFCAGYLAHVLSHEQEWLSTYFANVKRYQESLRTVPEIKEQRLRLNHAQIMAAAKATQAILIPQWHNDRLKTLFSFIKDRAIDRQNRLEQEHKDLADFWGVFRYLDQKPITIIDEDGENDRVIENRLNHSQNPETEIAINIPHMTELAGAHRLKIPDEITKHFPNSVSYKFKDYKKIRSRVQKGRSLWCWIFERPKNDDN